MENLAKRQTPRIDEVVAVGSEDPKKLLKRPQGWHVLAVLVPSERQTCPSLPALAVDC
jgi:hypothetical protein